MFWLRQAGVVLVFLGSIFLFPGLQRTPEKLLSMVEAGWPRRDALRNEWRTERAGETVLPAKAQAIIGLLRENQVKTFRYSDAIARDADTSVPQRIAESAFPIRLVQGAPHLILLAGEPLAPACRQVAQRQEVVLAACP